MNTLNKNINFDQNPNKEINTKSVFGIDCSFKVYGFESKIADHGRCLAVWKKSKKSDVKIIVKKSNYEKSKIT